MDERLRPVRVVDPGTAATTATTTTPAEILQAAAAAPLEPVDRYGVVMAESVRSTLGAIAADELQAACGLLADRRRAVLTAGGATTHVLARHLAAQLQQIRPGVRFLGDSPADAACGVVDTSPGDTAVVFDHRRYEQRTLALAGELRRRSARIVLLTDTWASPVSRVADHVLVASVEGAHGFDSLVPTLAVVEALVDTTARLLGDSAIDRIHRFSQASVAAAPRSGGPAPDHERPVLP